MVYDGWYGYWLRLTIPGPHACPLPRLKLRWTQMPGATTPDLMVDLTKHIHFLRHVDEERPCDLVNDPYLQMFDRLPCYDVVIIIVLTNLALLEVTNI